MAPKPDPLKLNTELPDLNASQADELRTWVQLKLMRRKVDRFVALDLATEIVAEFGLRGDGLQTRVRERRTGKDRRHGRR